MPEVGYRGTGGMFEGSEANLAAYVKYHLDTGSNVHLTKIPTTSEQERNMIDRALEIGDRRGLTCARSTSDVLSTACEIESAFWPGNLHDQAQRTSCPVE